MRAIPALPASARSPDVGAAFNVSRQSARPRLRRRADPTLRSGRRRFADPVSLPRAPSAHPLIQQERSHPRRRQAATDARFRRVAIALPVPGSFRSAWQRQRQGQRRGAGMLCPTELPCPHSGFRELRGAKRLPCGMLPPSDGGAVARPRRDDRPKIGARSCRVPETTAATLRRLREGRDTGLFTVAGSLSAQRVLGPDDIRSPRRACSWACP